MPLIKSSSDVARSQNIAEMIRSGHKPDQAVAASYQNQRDARRKGMAHGGAVTVRDMNVDDSHLKGAPASLPKHQDKDTSGPVPMRHRNRLGVTDLQANPQGAGRPSTESKMGNGNRKSW